MMQEKPGTIVDLITGTRYVPRDPDPEIRWTGHPKRYYRNGDRDEFHEAVDDSGYLICISIIIGLLFGAMVAAYHNPDRGRTIPPLTFTDVGEPEEQYRP